jgi:hypothetical protein
MVVESMSMALSTSTCEKRGRTIHTMIHDTSEQNRIAECLNRTLLEHARMMLFTAGLPCFLWLEAVHHTVYLKNRLPTRALGGKTPHEAMGMGIPDVSDLHKWGCTIWVQVEAGKLDARAVETHFVRYGTERKGFCVYWPLKRRISVERNVRFVPNEILVPEGIKSEREQMIQQRPQQPPPVQAPIVKAPIPPAVAPIVPAPADPDDSEGEDPPVAPRRLPDSLNPHLPGYGHGQRPRRPPGDYARMDKGDKGDSEESVDILLDESEDDSLENFALAVWNEDDLKSIKDALARPEAHEWKRAMETKIKQLEHLNTWELVYPPAGVNVINSGFVYRKKRDNRGHVSSYKARFVGKFTKSTSRVPI